LRSRAFAKSDATIMLVDGRGSVAGDEAASNKSRAESSSPWASHRGLDPGQKKPNRATRRIGRAAKDSPDGRTKDRTITSGLLTLIALGFRHPQAATAIEDRHQHRTSQN
jgi:hypothetical protein